MTTTHEIEETLRDVENQRDFVKCEVYGQMIDGGRETSLQVGSQELRGRKEILEIGKYRVMKNSLVYLIRRCVNRDCPDLES